MTEFYTIIEDLGSINDDKEFPKFIRIVSWKNTEPKIDIRRWKNNKPLKGIALNIEEAKNLHYILSKYLDRI